MPFVGASKKREDLQCLRGLAILAVLLFHIWPTVFQNGYIGVDIFFVLSGYLMASMMMRDDKPLSPKTIFQFYYKRVRRLVPLYLVNTFIVWLLSQIFIYPGDNERMVKDIKWALAYASNIEMTREPNRYFALLPTYKAAQEEDLDRTQFMLLALLVTRVSRSLGSHSTKLLLLIFAISKYVDIYRPDKRETFNLLHARAWQFIVGMIAHDVGSSKYKKASPNHIHLDMSAEETKTMSDNVPLLEKEDIISNSAEEISKLHIYTAPSSHSTIAFYSLSTALFMSTLCAGHRLPTLWFRTFATVAAGLYIYVCVEHQPLSYATVKVPIGLLVYLGDISYSLYLIHWPIVIFMRYWMFAKLDLQTGSMTACISVVMAIQIHNWFEKPLIDQSRGYFFVSNTVVFLYTTLAVALCWQAQYAPSKAELSPFSQKLWDYDKMLINDETHWSSVADLITQDRLVEIIGKAASYKCLFLPKSNHTALKDATFSTEIDGSGNLTVLILGNSHAQCLTPLISRLLDGKYAKIYMRAHAGCVPFKSYLCAQLWPAHIETARIIKPDLLFLIFKYGAIMNKAVSEPAGRDIYVRALQSSLNQYLRYAKHIFVNEKNLEFGNSKDIAGDIGRRIWQAAPLHVFQRREEDVFSEHRNALMKTSAVTCNRCIWMNFTGPFCSNGTCSAFDLKTRIPLFWDFNHVTPFGAERLAPVIESALKRVGL